jgi:hypothetical protein
MSVHASNMLYLFVLILQSYCLCCYLFIFSCFVMIHVSCLYAYYIYMIYMFYVPMFHIVMDIFEIMTFMINYILYVIIVMLIYEIKIIWKMPIFLTVTEQHLKNIENNTGLQNWQYRQLLACACPTPRFPAPKLPTQFYTVRVWHAGRYSGIV